MVESEKLVGQNEDEIRIVGEQDQQAAAIKIVPSKPQYSPSPILNDERKGVHTPLPIEGRENVEERVINGACGGNAIPSCPLPHEESLPLKADIERNSNRLCGEDSLPSPVILGPSPPDGGFKAWIVMLASFLCNGIIFGTINSGALIFEALLEILKEEGKENPASLASLTISLAIGTTFFLSMVAGVLTDKLGIRVTTIAGGAIASLGMFLASLYYTQANILIVAIGLVFGTGASLAYTPSLVILGHYFSKRLGIVNGFVTAGSSLFTIIITQLLDLVIGTHGLKTAFQMLSGLMVVLVVCGFIFKPLLPDIPVPNESFTKGQERSCQRSCRSFFALFINFEIWKNKRFVIWTLTIPLALFGYFVPYVHLYVSLKLLFFRVPVPRDGSQKNRDLYSPTRRLQQVRHRRAAQRQPDDRPHSRREAQQRGRLQRSTSFRQTSSCQTFGCRKGLRKCSEAQNDCARVKEEENLRATVSSGVNEEGGNSLSCVERPLLTDRKREQRRDRYRRLLNDKKVSFSNSILGEGAKSKVLIQCIGGTSGLGRILFGLIADRPCVNRIFLQQLSFFCIGTLTMLLTCATRFWMFIVIVLFMGLFDGCFISLLGPIAFDIVGPSGASQAIGCLLALCSIPLTIGPFVAGRLYDYLQSYTIPFLCAGIPPLVGGFALFAMKCVKDPPKGCVASPVRDSTEMKNNVAVANPDTATPAMPETQALMPGESQLLGSDLLQVDVRHLVNLQRESSV